MTRRVQLIIFIFTLCILSKDVSCQYVYKTPSGSRYHLASCSSVKNVSKRITIKQATSQYGLSSCKRCKPPSSGNQLYTKSSKNKAVGKCTSVICSGWAKTKNRQCSRSTKMCNGYCFQHQPKEE